MIHVQPIVASKIRLFLVLDEDVLLAKIFTSHEDALRVAALFDAPQGTQGICRRCGCTDQMPCADSCAWVDDERTLCSSCADEPTTEVED